MKINKLLYCVFGLMLVALAACSGQNTPAAVTASPVPTGTGAPAAAATIEPTHAVPDLNQPGVTPKPGAPQVISRKPALDEEAQPGTTVELAFDQAMDQLSVQSAFHLKDASGIALGGQFTWPGPETLCFTPEKPLVKGAYYQVGLDVTARAENQQFLGDAYTFRFKTTAALQVSQVYPLDGADGVKVDSAVTVIFNRPVTELGTLEDQTRLPQPLVFSPELKGKGEWVNTSTYVFHPAQIFSSGTRYSVTIAAGLKDASGSADMAMAADTKWQFTTLKPMISTLNVDASEIDLTSLAPGAGVGLLPKIRLSFSQAMDPASTAKAISLLDSNQQLVPVGVQWNTDGRMLTLTPGRMLALGADYSLDVSTEAHAGDGGALNRALQWNFTTVPAPGVDSTYPADGSNTESSYYFSIAFKSPMRQDMIPGLVKITPEPGGKLDWLYNTQDKTAFFYGLKPSTDYTVTILPGMLDLYGNATHEKTSVHFTTAAAQAQLYLNMPSQPLYRTDTPQMFFVSSTNVHTVNVVVYKAPTGDLAGWKSIDEASLLGASLVAKFDYAPTAAADKGSLSKVEIKTLDGKPLPPGAYFLGIDSKDIKHENRFIDGRYFLITDTFLVFKDGPSDSLVWAVQPQTGKPIEGQALSVYGVDENHNSTLLGSGKTDANGLLHVSFQSSSASLHYVTSPDGAPFTFASSSWGSEVSLENFGIPNVYGGSEFNTMAYVYSDRPLYRPGQTVYFKGILRTDDDLTYLIPQQKEVEVVINSYDKEVLRKTLPVSASGTFDGQFQLDKEAALGNYSMVVQKPGEDTSRGGQSYGTLSFNVAEYRKPEFQVDLKADPGDVLLGNSFTASLAASYYSGGPLDQASVNWVLRAQPFIYNPPDAYSTFSFSNPASDDAWFAYGNTLPNQSIIRKGQVQTDASGKAQFKVPAVVETSADSQVLNLEANLTDLSGNLVSSQVTVNAHRALIYPGIRPKQYVGKVGEDQPFEIVVLDWDGKPVDKQQVSVAISERHWLSVQKTDAQGVLRWETNVKDIPTATVSQVTDEKGLATALFKPVNGGTYRAVVTVVDKGGHTNRSATYLWVAGSEYVPWRQTNDRSFQLITDRTSYNPGDQADVLIASPFQGDAYALVTVERGKIRQQEVVLLNSNSTVYHLPVTVDMGPAVYISVTVVKGVDKNNPRPTYKTGITRINVSTDQKVLHVDVTPDHAQSSPGEKVTYTIKTSDAAGKPVPAELSLALSDLASLALSGPNSDPIDHYFYGMRGLLIQTVASFSASIEEYNARLNQMASEGAGAGSGGDKGGAVMGVMDVRQNFPDTAYWNAVVQTDGSGQAAVTVTLPDNLTTWRMDARAVTTDTLVGQTKVDIVSSKQLLVRPQTPRFFISGDQSQVSAAIHNDTGKDQTVTASLKAQGVELQGSAEQQVQIAAGKQALVTWKINVPASSSRVDMVFSAKAGDFQDASTPPLGTLDQQGLPVYRFETPETVGSSGEVAAAETRSESIRLPVWADVSQGNLKVELEPSLAAGMTRGFDYLTTYPYDTTEVDISRFLPDVALLKALKSGGQTDPALKTNLENQLNTGVQRLYARQNSDGGWGWWSGSTSDPMTSAYVLLGLAEAQEYGTQVDSTVLENGKNYLVTVLNVQEDDRRLTPLAVHNRQAFFLYVLTRNSYYQTNVADKLFDERPYLSLYAKAFLAQTLWLQNNQDDRLALLRSELGQAAVLSASGASWQETTPDPWNWNTDTRSTAIVLNAMLTLDPKSELDANAVRWLMAHRRNGAWDTTQENAWALIALSKWLETSGELQGNYAYAVGLNGKTLGQGQVNSGNLQQSQTLSVDVSSLIKDQANKLLVARSDGSGRLYYSTFLTLSLPVNQVKPVDQGMTLTRRYFYPGDMKTPVTQAAAGDILEAEVTVTVANSLHYVQITDPLPAGMEAVDSSLKTSPQPTIPDGFDWSNFADQCWGWWYFNHSELRDEKVVLFADELPRGTYVYHYRVRAVTPGTYQVIPTTGQEVYFPDVYGRGAGSEFTIK